MINKINIYELSGRDGIPIGIFTFHGSQRRVFKHISIVEVHWDDRFIVQVIRKRGQIVVVGALR